MENGGGVKECWVGDSLISLLELDIFDGDDLSSSCFSCL